MVIKCNFADYYDTGIRINDCLSILSGILSNETTVLSELREPKKTREKMFFINMSSLGFVEGLPDNPAVTPRGLSFLCGRILLTNEIVADKSLESMIARFALLKAVADIDWECFTRMIWLEDVDGLSLGELHNRYYKYDTKRNFKHRRAMHRTISRETSFSKVLTKSHLKEVNEIELLNPYNIHFKAKDFFPRKISDPTKSDIIASLNKSLALYPQLFKEHRPFGFSELLKSLIEVFLLENNSYYSEPQLCEFCMKELYRRKISLFRSSRPLQIMGRGFYLQRGRDLITYPSFRV